MSWCMSWIDGWEHFRRHGRLTPDEAFGSNFKDQSYWNKSVPKAKLANLNKLKWKQTYSEGYIINQANGSTVEVHGYYGEELTLEWIFVTENILSNPKIALALQEAARQEDKMKAARLICALILEYCVNNALICHPVEELI